MATRQRLRAALDVRRVSRPCWRCALNLSRHQSTSAASTEESSESMNRVLYDGMNYDKMRVIHDWFKDQDIDDKLETVKRDIQTSSAEVATTRSDESIGHSSQTAHGRSAGVEGLPSASHVPTIPYGSPVRSDATKDSPGCDERPMQTSFPRIRFIQIDTNPVIPRSIHPYNVSERVEFKGLDHLENDTLVPHIRKRIRGFFRKYIHKYDKRPIQTSFPRIHSIKIDTNPAIPRLIYLYNLSERVKFKELDHLKNDTLTPHIRKRIGGFFRKYIRKDTSDDKNIPDHLPSGTEHLSRVTTLARGTREVTIRKLPCKQTSDITTLAWRKIPILYRDNDLNPLIRKLIIDYTLAPLIRKLNSDDKNISDHLPSATEHLRSIATLARVTREGAIPRKVITNSIIPREWGTSRDATETISEAPGEDEPSSDELVSWLDELQALVSDMPDVTTTNGFAPSNPHSSRQYLATPPASSWNPTSARQSLESSKMSFSIWSSKAAKRYYATAANRTLQTAPPIDPPSTETNLAGSANGRPRGIREALSLWQEQHESTLADTSTRHVFSTLNDSQNLLNQSGEDDSATTIIYDDEMSDDEEVSMDPEERNPDIFAPQEFLRRGDLVQLKTATQPVLAIFVRNLTDQCQFYTIRGQWINRTRRGIPWGLSRFVDPDDLNELLPYLPAEEVAEERMNRLQPVDVSAPRDAGAKLIEQMSLFQRTTDAVFRQHAERINRLYEIIAPPEGSKDQIYLSLKDIAMKVLMKQESELTAPMMYAIQCAIDQNQNIMWGSSNYRQNPIFEISPRQSLMYLDQVRVWVREYQEKISQMTMNESMSSIEFASNESTISLNPISTFVQKAQVAIQQSRQTRPLSQSGFIGPSSVRLDIESIWGMPYKEIQLQEFNFNEKIIIHYLDVWATSSHVNPNTNLASLGPMILRAVGMYEGLDLDRSKGFTFLQELGVVTPWENRTAYKLRRLNLPGHDGGSREASRLLQNAYIETENFEPKDSMEGLRKDWGDMPVFCVDSAATRERDDGVSLEPVENDPSLHWVHVHVANPSAFIGPNSATAKFAASLSESFYFPERKYSMLKPELTSDQLGLAKDRPCITFSAKISADGDVLEKKITPGIVRNVHFHTPQSVGQALGLIRANEESELESILTVGGRMPDEPVDRLEQTSKVVSDPEHIKILRKLFDLSEAAYQKRVPAGFPDFHWEARTARTYPTVYVGKLSSIRSSPIEHQHVRRFEGDPIISVQRTTESYGLVSDMVSKLMVLAGDVGASWCAERNIPIPYRGILRNPEPVSSPEDFKREVLDPKVAKKGYAETTDLRAYMAHVGVTHTSDRPLEHFTLGLPAYCKATSPLRRYCDMYAHWQMEAAIRHEAATGTSLIGSTDDSYLPFSRAEVAEYAAGAGHRERRVRSAKQASQRHWVCQALFRALRFNEAALPEGIKVSARASQRMVRGLTVGWCDLFDLGVSIRYTAAVTEEGGLRDEDVWEARVGDVDPYYLVIYMDPVRLLTRDPDAVEL